MLYLLSAKGEAVKAGTLYLVMTHIGTAFIAAAFLLMYKHAGSFDIYEIKNSATGKINLVPARKEFVNSVEINNKLMIIEPIEGLLDL